MTQVLGMFVPDQARQVNFAAVTSKLKVSSFKHLWFFLTHTMCSLRIWSASQLSTHLDLAIRAAAIWNYGRLKSNMAKLIQKLLIESATRTLCLNSINQRNSHACTWVPQGREAQISRENQVWEMPKRLLQSMSHITKNCVHYPLCTQKKHHPFYRD